ncbi:synaptotagmin-13 [Protopterus annectens]|uniref:synaptotagmin-13 n=1 Tax=Protopterus annectens TaxID=7888 RepID=UPI001CF9CC66|nr:synaptotagmin-13 [Protopterus annectens]
MILSGPVILLGATLGTATGLLAICGLTYLCNRSQKGKGDSKEKHDDLESEDIKPSVHHSGQQFSVKKSAEPIQPRALFSFPKIYGPKPAVTSPEIINYADYALGTTDKMAANTSSSIMNNSTTQKAESEEIFIISKQGTADYDSVSSNLTMESQGTQDQSPKLHCLFRYDSQSCKLQVTVFEAIHVNAGGNQDCCTCYVLICLSTATEKKETHTSFKRKLPHPIWEETLTLPLAEENITDGMLTLSLCDCDKYSRHSTIGETSISFANVHMPPGKECWLQLNAPEKDPNNSVGELLLSVSYLPAANRLIVVVMKARGLHSESLKDVIDLSVKLTLKHQSVKLKKKQTKRVKYKINPVWNEMIMFEVPLELLSKSIVELEMLNQDTTGRNQLLGRCTLGQQSDSMGLSHWQEMLNNPRKQIAMWHQLK